MKIKKVYLGRRQIYPDGWSPGENTILYMPFNNDLLDHSNNNIQFTNTNVTLENDTAYFNGSNAKLENDSFTTYLNSDPFTCSVRVKSKTFVDQSMIISSFGKISGNWHGWNLGHVKNSGNKYRAESCVSNGTGRAIYTPCVLNQRDLLTYVRTTTELKLYKNGTLVDSVNAPSISYRTNLTIGQNLGESSASLQKYFNGWMSELIIENKARTAEEIENYYNQTKSNYGL